MNPYVAAGYGVTLVTLALYAMHVLHRGRTLSRDASPAPSGDAVPAPTPERERP